MAYTQAKAQSADINADGSLTILIVYHGNAGEPNVQIPVIVRQGTVPDATFLRAEAIRQLAVLNAGTTYNTFVKTVLNQLIDVTPITPPTPSADDVAVAAFTTAVLFAKTLAAKVPFGLAQAADVQTQRAAVATLYAAGSVLQQGFFDSILRMNG